MRTWAKLGLGFIVAVALGGAVVAMKGRPEISIKCTATGDSGSCVFKNAGQQLGNVEVDVIAVCKDGEHVAHVGAQVDAGSHVTKIIDSFTPGIGAFSSCAGIDYRNFVVK